MNHRRSQNLSYSAIFYRFLPSSVIALLAASSLAAAPPPAVTAQSSFLPLSAAERSELTWLPTVAVSQQKVFAYLAAKVGGKLYRPEPPTDAGYTGQWFFARQPFSHDPHVVYPVIYENLLVAKKLLSGTDPDGQRLGLVIARYSNLWLRQNLNDTTLSPRLMEAFLLPYLNVAYLESWREVSRREILEDANDAYRDAGEADHQVAILRHIIHFGFGRNNIDWARMELGEAMAAQGKYAEAIASVNAITDSGMAGAKLLAVDWKKKLAASQALKSSTPIQSPGPSPTTGSGVSKGTSAK